MKYKQLLKLLACLFVTAVVCVLFFHYKEAPVFPQQTKIGATYMTMNNDFYKYLNAEVEKSVNERHDQLYTRDPALSIKKQVEQVRFFIREKVDVIIINPVDSNSRQLIASLKKAKKEGIKVIAVDSQFKDSSAVDTTIVSDNYKAGVLCAEQMMKTKKSADILLLEHRDALSATSRIQGFLDTIKKHKAYRIVSRIDSLGQTEIAMPKVKKLIQDGLDFDTVMALNDRAAIGALAAIKGEQMADTQIYGIDGSPDMKSLLAATPEIQATVAQSPYTMGQEVIKATSKLSKNQTYPKEIIVPVQLLTKKNIGEADLAGWQ
ncbi:substrate-binding domain-containing protein [Streptococcus ratti]|uniref:Periplasmic sugar-binding protein n=1 Tax=Streptococcus ratti FA-1 = DSM 20564 TaxID=699248 RepID=A0ABP2R111_STRRT|nr:sugar ABC transporter substrate-binding protein [Streptococcus ratti]EJN95010.1 putative periplasmic sugar-binding protein [Streptococcus ratti FA-1 = DSM 20564]EMP69597.1 putative periplasmic sugar-binding protein [Streptococcus ratti FA-1 = DSM 20564]QEY06903.1 sugar ABC transporter substrate-binding protein [Streptococcus ratti]VEI59324.1 periplasmic sugar-binding protein [Streptococcus mutans]